MYSNNGYWFYIPDLNIYCNIWVIDEIFYIHRGEIMDVIESISLYTKDDLVPIVKDVSENTRISETMEECGVSFSYPYKYENYIYYGTPAISGATDELIIFHDFNREDKNSISIYVSSDIDSKKIDLSEIDEDKTIITNSGEKLYLTSDYVNEERNIRSKKYNIGEYEYRYIHIWMDCDYYEAHLDEITEFLMSISSN